jgi:hypothetical protein
MISNADVEQRLRTSASGLHMQTPVEAIIENARRRRRSRRTIWSAVAVAGCAAMVLVAIAFSAADQATRRTPNAGLTAFTLRDGPAGSASLTLHKGAQYRLDPDALRRALAERGVPALVTVNKSCDSSPEPDGLDNVVTAYRQDDGNVFLTIDPAAMPMGAQLSIGYFPNHTTFNLIETNAPQRCHP